jgi:hypothetical protein
MKIRIGFVSNSSSSSFIIANKGSANDLKKKIKELFKLPAEHPMSKMSDDIVRHINNEIKLSNVVTIEDLKDYDENDPIKEAVKEARDKNLTVYNCSFYTGDTIDITDLDINIHEDDFYFVTFD